MIGRKPPDRNPRVSKRDRRERHWEKRGGQTNESLRDFASAATFIVVDGRVQVSPAYPITPTTVVFGWRSPSEFGSTSDDDRPVTALLMHVRSLAKQVGASAIHHGTTLRGVAVTFRTQADVAKLLLYYSGKAWVGHDGCEDTSQPE